jgi:hypothetical protein
VSEQLELLLTRNEVDRSRRIRARIVRDDQPGAHLGEIWRASRKDASATGGEAPHEERVILPIVVFGEMVQRWRVSELQVLDLHPPERVLAHRSRIDVEKRAPEFGQTHVVLEVRGPRLLCRHEHGSLEQTLVDVSSLILQDEIFVGW